MTGPFHEGEKQIQELTCESGAAAANGRLIADRITINARLFITQQRYCVLGWVMPDKSVWASFMSGTKEFATADSEGALLRMRLSNETGLGAGLSPVPKFQEGDQLGVLFIELSTRRRLRVNGQVTMSGGGEFYVNVSQAYPNCLKYIQRRERVKQSEFSIKTSVEEGTSLHGELEEWIMSADTFFVASAYPEGLVDVSHRGGKPGFIKLENGRLIIPDYPGNSMFGTLGNFAVNAHAGLVFIDFTSNRQLQLTGDVVLDLEAGRNIEATGGTGRWWEFTPRKWIISPLNIEFGWSHVENSPFNP